MISLLISQYYSGKKIQILKTNSFFEKKKITLSMRRLVPGYGRQVLERVTIYCYFPLGMVATTTMAE
jgi:hypothetical protein